MHCEKQVRYLETCVSKSTVETLAGTMCLLLYMGFANVGFATGLLVAVVLHLRHLRLILSRLGAALGCYTQAV